MPETLDDSVTEAVAEPLGVPVGLDVAVPEGDTVCEGDSVEDVLRVLEEVIELLGVLVVLLVEVTVDVRDWLGDPEALGVAVKLPDGVELGVSVELEV